jgi:hypothetical protein
VNPQIKGCLQLFTSSPYPACVTFIPFPSLTTYTHTPNVQAEVQYLAIVTTMINGRKRKRLVTSEEVRQWQTIIFVETNEHTAIGC